MFSASRPPLLSSTPLGGKSPAAALREGGNESGISRFRIHSARRKLSLLTSPRAQEYRTQGKMNKHCRSRARFSTGARSLPESELADGGARLHPRGVPSLVAMAISN